MVLNELRERIDEIDKEIVELYEERMKISEGVGQFKIETGKKVFDKDREIIKLDSVEALATSDLNKVGIRELYEHIMSMSRKIQYQLMEEHAMKEEAILKRRDGLDIENPRVVFQGLQGAYSQAALYEYFGNQVQASNVETFRDAMMLIAQGGADYAVLPIENSSAGAVTQVYDLLVEFDNYIIGEVEIPIEHTLSALPGSTIENIEKVYSHPQALMQSEKFLDAHRAMEQISIANTAVAAQKILEDNDNTQAAICSKYASELYGLKILEEKINHNANNSTRFIVITSQKIFLKGAKKISICFEIPHESGTLYHLLSNFIYNDLSMTKIESRPIEGRNWEYRFFVDFEGVVEEAAVKNALRGLSDEAKNLKVLGNY